MKDKIIIATKKDWFTDMIESKKWTKIYMNFFAHKKEDMNKMNERHLIKDKISHIDKIKDHCEAKRPCNNTHQLHYCEACDITLCSKHYR